MKSENRNTNWTDIDMREFSLEKLILHFAQSNKAEGKSPKTIEWYTQMLTAFTAFVELIGASAVLSEFNVTMVRQFMVQEQARGVSPYTVQGKVRALKAFGSWLFTEGYTSENILRNVKLPKVPVKVIEPLTETEIDALLSVQNPLTAVGCRSIAILITLLDTGLRAGELCSLHFEDTHIMDGNAKVLGKGSKERVVPIGALAQKVLWRYVFHFRPEPLSKTDDYLFLTLDGGQLRPDALKLLLKRWGARAGVPRLHAHLCRHSFATNFLSKKMR